MQLDAPGERFGLDRIALDHLIMQQWLQECTIARFPFDHPVETSNLCFAELHTNTTQSSWLAAQILHSVQGQGAEDQEFVLHSCRSIRPGLSALIVRMFAGVLPSLCSAYTAAHANRGHNVTTCRAIFRFNPESLMTAEALF